jgi:hypothetical protein
LFFVSWLFFLGLYYAKICPFCPVDAAGACRYNKKTKGSKRAERSSQLQRKRPLTINHSFLGCFCPGKTRKEGETMEEYTPENQESESEEEGSDQFKRWFQDNLRIIISVVIVVLIAGGIYSYSKRSESPVISDNSASTVSTSDQSQTDNSATVSGNNQNTPTSSAATAVSTPASSSQETESSFIETAGKGDSVTTLARHAAADYLEKNADSSLTKEHKIYIEDYLRKNVGSTGHIKVGTSVSFSKDLISQAITHAKNLTPSQLKNLQKYSARVSSL